MPLDQLPEMVHHSKQLIIVLRNECLQRFLECLTCAELHRL